jgi:AraC-like DNA-binding protein
MFHSVHIPLCFQRLFPSLGVQYQEIRPHQALFSHVAYFWRLRFKDCDYPIKITPPDGGSDIIIDRENPDSPVLFGQSTSFFTVPKEPNQDVFGVRLKPGAAHILFKVPAADLYDAAIPLSCLLSRQEFRDYQSLMAPDLWPPQDGMIRWLTGLIDSDRKDDSPLINLQTLMERIRPGVSIDMVVKSLDSNPRQVERLFNRVYGMPPKSLLRIKRFQAVLTQKNRNAESSWSDISQNLGYSDQSHLCREFKAFTGMAPQEYFSHPLI